jgi:L-alanine-DL-glutamate epimerase-like enolase superfamily enzyme
MPDNLFKNVALVKAEVFMVKVQVDSPVRTSFGTMKDRPSVLIRLEDKDGVHGWGEVWCNFPDGGAEHRANLIVKILLPLLKTQNEIDVTQIFSFLTQETHILKIQCGEPGPISQCIAGIDIAAWDLIARKCNQSLHKLLNRKSVEKVPVYASGISPQKALETVKTSRGQGHCAFKLKIGFGDKIDLQNILQIAGQLLPNEVLMLDANQAWNLHEAKDFAAKISNVPIEWLEEPLSADRPVEEWAELSSKVPFPLAAGENIQGMEDFENTISAGHVLVIQPDLCKWGGVSGCLKVAGKAIEAGRRYCPHYLGGGIGLLASAHVLAAAGGGGLLEVDVNHNPLREGLAMPFPEISNGFLFLPSGSGLGVEPDPKVIDEHLVLRQQYLM